MFSLRSKMLASLALFNLTAIEAESIDARPRCACTGQAWSSSLNSIVKAFAATWGQMDLLRRRSFKNSRALTKQSSCRLAAAISDKTSFSSFKIFKSQFLPNKLIFCNNIQKQFLKKNLVKVFEFSFFIFWLFEINFEFEFEFFNFPYFSFQRLTFVFIQFDVCFFSVLVQLNVFWKMCEEDRGGGELRWEFQSAAFVNEGQNATELNLRRSSNSVFEVTTKVAPHSHRSAKMSTHNEGTYAAAVLERLKKMMGNRELKWQMSKNNEEGMQDFCNNERVP